MTGVALVQCPGDQRTKDPASSLMIVFLLGSSPGRLKLKERVPSSCPCPSSPSCPSALGSPFGPARTCPRRGWWVAPRMGKQRGTPGPLLWRPAYNQEDPLLKLGLCQGVCGETVTCPTSWDLPSHPQRRGCDRAHFKEGEPEASRDLHFAQSHTQLVSDTTGIGPPAPSPRPTPCLIPQPLAHGDIPTSTCQPVPAHPCSVSICAFNSQHVNALPTLTPCRRGITLWISFTKASPSPCGSAPGDHFRVTLWGDTGRTEFLCSMLICSMTLGKVLLSSKNDGRSTRVGLLSRCKNYNPS